MFVLAPVQADSRSDVLAKLNNSSSTKGSEDVKSWKIFFDGCLQITAPPKAISESFNMNTVWPGVEGWDALAAWAQTNEHMAGVVYRVC